VIHAARSDAAGVIQAVETESLRKKPG